MNQNNNPNKNVPPNQMQLNPLTINYAGNLTLGKWEIF